MINILDQRDPLLFNEVNSLKKRRIRAKIALEQLLHEIASRVAMSDTENNHRLREMLSFSLSAFDEALLDSHTVEFFIEQGFNAKLILDHVERFRFELRLLEEDMLEDCYEEVAIYLEYLIEVYYKISDIRDIYNSEMSYLQN